MVLSIGEILVDIFVDGNNKKVFAGGAPFNVASNISHFGSKVAFFGAVGKDEYGAFLKDFAKKRISFPYIEELIDKQTTQAIVTLKDGERSFAFIREEGADYNLDITKLEQIPLKSINVAHIGSLMLSKANGRDFFAKAISYLKNKNIKISFDVNYRDDIFSSQEEAKEVFISAIRKADILKFTEEELLFLTGEDDIHKSLLTLLNDSQIAVVTLGSKGSIFFSKDKYISVPTYPLKPVDTTGAGDAFYSYFLYAYDKGLDISDDSKIKEALTYANISGGLTTQKVGAIDAAPSIKEIEEYYQSKR